MKIQSADQYYILTLSRGTREYTRKRFSMVLKSTWGSITCNQTEYHPPNKREEETNPGGKREPPPFYTFRRVFSLGKIFLAWNCPIGKVHAELGSPKGPSLRNYGGCIRVCCLLWRWG